MLSNRGQEEGMESSCIVNHLTPKTESFRDIDIDEELNNALLSIDMLVRNTSFRIITHTSIPNT